MYDFVPDSDVKQDEDEDNNADSGKKIFSTSDFNKLDYTLPTTASQVFRANFIINKTFR